MLKRLEKDWDKEERKKRLIVKEPTEEVTTSPTQKTPPKLQSTELSTKTTLPVATSSVKDTEK